MDQEVQRDNFYSKEFSMHQKLGVLILSLAALTPTFATDAAMAEAMYVIALKNGETLYIFEDGLMAKEDKYGRAIRFKKGEVVQTIGGRYITPVGDEVARLNILLTYGHQN